MNKMNFLYLIIALFIIMSVYAFVTMDGGSDSAEETTQASEDVDSDDAE